VSGVVLGAAYMLRMYQRVMFGELDTRKNGELEDMTRSELAVLAPLLALIVLLGVYPQPFLGMIETSVATTLEHAGLASPGSAHAAVRSAASAAACEAVPGSSAEAAFCGDQKADHASAAHGEHAASAGAHR